MKATFALLSCTVCLSHFSQAASTLVDSSFSIPADGITNVGLTGLADWGYFVEQSNTNNMWNTNPSNVNFDSLTLNGAGAATVSSGSSSIGGVFFTEGYDGSGDGDGGSPSSASDFTFGGTATGAVGANFSSTENFFQMDFTDLGAGTHTVSLYMGHTNTGRTFTVGYELLASDGNIGRATTTSSTITNNKAIYTIEFFTADPLADLSLDVKFGGSGAGAGIINGYTVSSVAIPEPQAALLGSVGLLLLLRRRR